MKNNLVVHSSLGSVTIPLKDYDHFQICKQTAHLIFIQSLDRKKDLVSFFDRNSKKMKSIPKTSTKIQAFQNRIGAKGFFCSLRVVGIGYRVFLVNDILSFKLGFSHFIHVQIPKSIRVFLPEQTCICFYGLDHNQVTQIASQIQQLKKPSPYKGKGLQKDNNPIRYKVGKKKS